jgi:phosphoesterase RecJ-like protein
MIDPAPILSFINQHQNFIVVGHKEPDGDCIGSQLALASFLRRTGKSVTLASVGPFKRTEVKAWQEQFLSAIPAELKSQKPAVLVLDCSTLNRVGDLEADLVGLPIGFIDHHASGESQGEALFVDTKAPSVTFLILLLIEAAGQIPTKEEAEFLLFGLCTDTGYFRHLDASCERVFQAAGRLARYGASPKEAFARMYGGKSLNSRLLLGEMLCRLESYFNGALYYTYETLEDTLRFGLEGRDSDSMYQLIQSITGCEAIFVVRQETETNCTVGFRSRDKIDVSAVAGALGGGGHKQAAGLSIPGIIPEVKERILKEFAPAFTEK